MDRVPTRFLACAATTLLALAGCSYFQPPRPLAQSTNPEFYQKAATRIEYTEVAPLHDEEIRATAPPVSILNKPPEEYWDVRLEEAIQLALTNSKVLRDLGGIVLRAPDSVGTVHDPAIVETDPRFGVEAALAAFDASFATSAFFEENDRALNNTFFGGGTRQFNQDLAVFQTEITKRAATGTEFFVRNNTEYDANNAPGNAFPSAWETIYEAELRHPLLQGSGVNFNRIAGPSEQPGVINGVLIARINSDIELADFEIGVRNFLNDVENAYWDLYYAYRDLNAKIAARDSALTTWRRVKSLLETGRRGGEAYNEAQARAQYFRFQEEVENALTGRLLEPTRTNNGSSGGTFRANGGVLVAERRLRLMMGLPISDGVTIRPVDEPTMARVLFDWNKVVTEGLLRRPEIRRQKWQVKQRELELAASKNFLLPTLDTVARYRWRGFGKDLFREHPNTDDSDFGEFNNAYDNLINGDFQEWQLGLEFSLPIGYRRAFAGVRNAELKLARERTILKEQERQVVHDLSNAVAELDRGYALLQTSFNGREAANEQLNAVLTAYEADQVQLDLVLDAQRRFSDAESRFFRALVEYVLAVKNVHLEKGSLLDYDGVFMKEGQWPKKAYRDAIEREALRTDPLCLERCLVPAPIVSGGPYPQQLPPQVPPHGVHVFDGELPDEHLAPPPDEVPASPADELPELEMVPPPSPESDAQSSLAPDDTDVGRAEVYVIEDTPIAEEAWYDAPATDPSTQAAEQLRELNGIEILPPPDQTSEAKGPAADEWVTLPQDSAASTFPALSAEFNSATNPQVEVDTQSPPVWGHGGPPVHAPQPPARLEKESARVKPMFSKENAETAEPATPATATQNPAEGSWATPVSAEKPSPAKPAAADSKPAPGFQSMDDFFRHQSPPPPAQ